MHLSCYKVFMLKKIIVLFFLLIVIYLHVNANEQEIAPMSLVTGYAADIFAWIKCSDGTIEFERRQAKVRAAARKHEATHDVEYRWDIITMYSAANIALDTHFNNWMRDCSGSNTTRTSTVKLANPELTEAKKKVKEIMEKSGWGSYSQRMSEVNNYLLGTSLSQSDKDKTLDYISGYSASDYDLQNICILSYVRSPIVSTYSKYIQSMWATTNNRWSKNSSTSCKTACDSGVVNFWDGSKQVYCHYNWSMVKSYSTNSSRKSNTVTRTSLPVVVKMPGWWYYSD